MDFNRFSSAKRLQKQMSDKGVSSTKQMTDSEREKTGSDKYKQSSERRKSFLKKYKAGSQKAMKTTGVVFRTKNKINVVKADKKEAKESKVVFNDPLYQGLDNQVNNKQQDNFGPWVQMDKISREKMSRNKTHRNLPTLIRKAQNSGLNDCSPCSQACMDSRKMSSTIFQRRTKVNSLSQFRSISLEFNQNRSIKLPEDRTQTVRNKKAPFSRPKDILNLITRKGTSSQKRSKFLFNLIFSQQEQSKAICQRTFRPKLQNVYLKLKLGYKPEHQIEKRSRQVQKEVKPNKLNYLLT